MKETNREMRGLLRNIIMKREKAMEMGISRRDDLLDILLEFNLEYFKENRGDGKEQGKMTIEDVIDECKLFYLAGQETTADLLTWVMVVLSMHPSWQARAREEVLNVFGKRKPYFDSLSRLKVVTMVLYEVLRLYPPAALLIRRTNKELEMGDGWLQVPSWSALVPANTVHPPKPDILGRRRQRFQPGEIRRWHRHGVETSNGLFSLQLRAPHLHRKELRPPGGEDGLSYDVTTLLLRAVSPSYQHEPSLAITLHPQHGAPLILRKIC